VDRLQHVAEQVELNMKLKVSLLLFRCLLLTLSIL
jgi:hypothetical protein